MSTITVRKKESPQRARKAKIMEKFVELINKYPTIMFADFARVPANHFQHARKELSPDIRFFVIKRRLVFKVASELDKKRLDKLLKHMPLNLVVIFSKKDPSETYRLITERKANVFLKPGDIAESNIIIPKGPTDIVPGHILTDLRAMNIPTKIQGGKIAIIENFTIAKKGEVISHQIADLLRNLDIKPLKVGFKIKAAVDSEGLLYLPEVLSIAREDVVNMLTKAHSTALSIAIEMREINKYTIKPLAEKAIRGALNLALEIGWISDKTIPYLIRKAVIIAKTLKEKVS